MMCVPISESTYIYVDNMWIIHNTSKPESTPKKKCHETAYNAVCNSVAMQETLTGHKDQKTLQLTYQPR